MGYATINLFKNKINKVLAFFELVFSDKDSGDVGD